MTGRKQIERLIQGILIVTVILTFAPEFLYQFYGFRDPTVTLCFVWTGMIVMIGGLLTALYLDVKRYRMK